MKNDKLKKNNSLLKDQNFKKDVVLAKIKYRKKRTILITSILLFLILLSSYRIFSLSSEKRALNEELTKQEQTIKELEKKNDANEVLIKKLKDPYFISDLVREEYGISYPGEIIFDIPNQPDFIEKAKQAIDKENAKKQLKKIKDSSLIDDDKIPELNKDKKQNAKNDDEKQEDDDEKIDKEKKQEKDNKNDENR